MPFFIAFSPAIVYTEHREILDFFWAGRKTQVHLQRGSSPLFFYDGGALRLKELSIFIDESGDFGEYDHRSPYYIITMVFHDQRIDIGPAVARLDQELS